LSERWHFKEAVKRFLVAVVRTVALQGSGEAVLVAVVRTVALQESGEAVLVAVVRTVALQGSGEAVSGSCCQNCGTSRKQ
jgi:hypothetical protein